MKSPAFPLYCNDLLDGAAFMSNEEFGIYVRLLCKQWTHGALPDDQTLLKNVVNVPKEIPLIVMEKFKVGADGKLRNDRMEIERLKQADFRSKQKANGNLGGRPKLSQQEPRNNPTVNPNGSPRDEEEECILSSSGKGDWGKPLLCLIPSSMAVDGFAEAWLDWIGYCAEKGHALTSYSAKQQMMKCERWGAPRSIKIIHRSIEKQWKNLLDDNDLSSRDGKSVPLPKEPAILKPYVAPVWMKNLEEIRRLLTDPQSNLLILQELGTALPQEGWLMLDKITEWNQLNKIMKEKA